MVGIPPFFHLSLKQLNYKKQKGACSHLNKFFEAIIIKIKNINDFFYIIQKINVANDIHR